MKKDQRIVITGATGLVGSYVVRRLLQKGYTNLTAVARGASSKQLLSDVDGGIQWSEGDVLDALFIREVLDGAEGVIHAAGKVSFDPAEEGEMFAVNVNGTANVVNGCIEAGVRRLVHVSSVSALSRPLGHSVLTAMSEWQNSPLNTPYAHSKYQAELEVHRGIAEGVSAAMVLPGTILGSGDWRRGSVRLFDVVYCGMPFYPSGINGFVDVRDVADISIRLLEEESWQGRWIACSESVPYKILMRKMAEYLGSTPPRWELNQFVARAGIVLDYLRSKIGRSPRFLSGHSYRVGGSKFCYDTTEVTTQLGYRFIPLDTTLRQTAEAFLQYMRDGVWVPLE